MDRFYVTTPIYYVNGSPHLGHAYTTVLADALARHHRQLGERVRFVTGSDEHGLKVQRAAEAAGLAPKALADQNAGCFRDLFARLGLSADRFIRTTDPDHLSTVETMVARLIAAGDVYLGGYEGWYAASDEAFYDEDEVVDGRAVESGSSVEWVREESYFFRLSRYQARLLEWYAQEPATIVPESRRNEVRRFVEGGLKDLSISRTTFSWGVPWPGDPRHVLYVWVDALTNYFTAAGGFTEASADWWPADLHIIGKDILRFHAVYWPAFLMSAELPLPRRILTHGWWTAGGEKQSKSRGNVVDVDDLLDRYQLDALRYFMFRDKPVAGDGSFSETRLLARSNAELADNLGNLVNRSLRMLERYRSGIVPAAATGDATVDNALRASLATTAAAIRKAMEDLDLMAAVTAFIEQSSALNLYVNDTQPWSLAKQGDEGRLDTVLYHAVEGLRHLAILGYAFLPTTSRAILGALGEPADEVPAWSGLGWGGLPAGRQTSAPPVLFPKLDAEALGLVDPS